MPNPPPNNISIQVIPNAGISQNNFNPSSNSVAISGQVSFTISPPTSPSTNVYTFQNGTLTSVFTSGSPPYSAPTSSPFTLLSSISGTVTLSLSSTLPIGPETGLNGTINVGGGGSGGDDDDDDSGGGGGHGRTR